MHYKTNRLNHDFQIAYFIAGSCQTPDAAYSILCDLKEDRLNAIKSFEASQLREKAKTMRAERKLLSEDEAERLEGQADIEEMKAMVDTVQRNYDAALAELDFINRCMEKLQPLRKFGHLPDAEAHEAAQHDEWKLQLVHTAENHLLSGHAIPADHFATMRMHPSFSSEILPSVDRLAEVLTRARAGGDGKLIASYLEKKKEESFNLPRLLGVPEQETKTEQAFLAEPSAGSTEQTTPSSPDYSRR